MFKKLVMFKKFWATLCLTVLLLAFWVPSASAYSPQGGAIFNRPIGNATQRNAIRTHINRTIASTPRGETIRIATYSIDRNDSTDALIAAHRRGVSVQMVTNHHWNSPQLRRLKSALGTNSSRRSFVVVCRNGCLGRAGSMHSKFFVFSRAGSARNVVMVSSANLTGWGANVGWNDVFTMVGSKTMFDAYQAHFAQMSRDRALADAYRVATSRRFRSYFFPRRGTSSATDTAYQALRQVRCTGANGGAGVGGRTVVRVSMFTWRDTRGMYLARRLRALDNAGCIVQVTVGAPSRDVMLELRRPTRHGGIQLRDSRYDENGDGQVDKYVHTKYMTISGVYGADRSAWYVFTGSHNWTPDALRRADEVMLRIDGRGTHGRYVSHFNDVRRSKTHAVSIRRAGLNSFTGEPFATADPTYPEPE